MCLHYAGEFLKLNSYSYLKQYSVPNVSTLVTTIFAWFVLSEFKWLWFVARNRYLQCNGVGEVGVLDEHVSGAWWEKGLLL